jgi:hypothetical protein
MTHLKWSCYCPLFQYVTPLGIVLKRFWYTSLFTLCYPFLQCVDRNAYRSTKTYCWQFSSSNHLIDLRTTYPKYFCYFWYTQEKSLWCTFLRASIGTFKRSIPSKVSQSNVRQRTDQIDVFKTEMSCLTIVWATIEGIRLRKFPL